MTNIGIKRPDEGAMNDNETMDLVGRARVSEFVKFVESHDCSNKGISEAVTAFAINRLRRSIVARTSDCSDVRTLLKMIDVLDNVGIN